MQNLVAPNLVLSIVWPAFQACLNEQEGSAAQRSLNGCLHHPLHDRCAVTNKITSTPVLSLLHCPPIDTCTSKTQASITSIRHSAFRSIRSFLPEAFLQQLVSSCSSVRYSNRMQQDSNLIPNTVKNILHDCRVHRLEKFCTGACMLESMGVG